MPEAYLTSIAEFLVAVIFSYLVSGLLANVFGVLGFRDLLQLFFFVLLMLFFYLEIKPRYLRSK